ncbi:hypothetical protein BHM03_00057871 [Ensete ventricosum]|nr:hypothetical protein BHM03_00057871 [Ensete ventricosum]
MDSIFPIPSEDYGIQTRRRGGSRPSHLQGWLATAIPLAGVASHPRGDARGGVTLGSGANRRGGRPLAGRLPTGKGSCLLRRGDDDDDIVRVRKEG